MYGLMEWNCMAVWSGAGERITALMTENAVID